MPKGSALHGDLKDKAELLRKTTDPRRRRVLSRQLRQAGVTAGQLSADVAAVFERQVAHDAHAAYTD